MSIRKKGKKYYYEIMYNGKRYNGICANSATKKQALSFEKIMKLKIAEENAQADQELYHRKAIEKLTNSTEIKLKDAFDVALKMPHREITPKTLAENRSKWLDFVAFMMGEYDIVLMNNVDSSHLGAYINYIRANGRYDKTLSYNRGTKEIKYISKNTSLSSSTLNKIQRTIQQIFKKLYTSCGMRTNPAADIPLIACEARDTESREAFSPDEVEKIINSNDNFIRPLFIVGLHTGLRFKDVVFIRWRNINLKNNIIVLKTFKTRELVKIPIVPRLRSFLEEWQKENKSEYLFPMQQEHYSRNKPYMSEYTQRFLNSLGIITERPNEKRYRKTTVKDFHSCRHTFATIGIECGISLEAMKHALGHSDMSITNIYTAHVNQDYLKKEFGRFSFEKRRNVTLLILKLSWWLNHFNELDNSQKVAFSTYLTETCDHEKLNKLIEAIRSAVEEKKPYEQKVKEFDNSEMGKNISQLTIENPEYME